MKKILAILALSVTFYSFFLFFFASSASAQCAVRGVVTYENGQPVPSGAFVNRPNGDCNASGLDACALGGGSGSCSLTMPPGTYCFSAHVGAQSAFSGAMAAPCGGTVSLTISGSPPPPPTPGPSPTTGPTPPPAPTPTPFPISGLVGTDCGGAVTTTDLTPIPVDGPAVRVTFQGSGNNVDPPPGVTCDNDPNFNKGEWVTVNWQTVFQLKDLESVFAKYNSDYSEGDFQDPTLSHQKENLLNLSSSQWNDYNGPAQKLTPKIIFNQEFSSNSDLMGLKIKYVQYVLDKPTRDDAKFTYTDIYGQGPALTIKQLHDMYGDPQPPTDTSTQAQKDQWVNTWGRYWDKIPLAKNDKAYGQMAIQAAMLDDIGNSITGFCASNFIYTIVVPEYFRTNQISAHLNRLLVPKPAQSPLTENPEEKSLAQQNSSICPFTKENAFSSPRLKSTTLIASSQPNFSPQEGQVLAALDDDTHRACLVPPADLGTGQDYCMPKQVTINSTPKDPPPNGSPGNNRIFVCAKKVCSGGDPGTCTATGQTSSACVGGSPTREFFSCSCTLSPPGCDPLIDPACTTSCSWNSTGSSYDAGCCYLSPDTKPVDIKTSITLKVPYLQSFWNKSTSDLDNKKSGFWGFFAPPVDNGTNTSVLLNQAPYEKHGESPGLNYTPLGGTNSNLVPPAAADAYPDFTAGVKNAQNWVRDALWPF